MAQEQTSNRFWLGSAVGGAVGVLVTLWLYKRCVPRPVHPGELDRDGMARMPNLADADRKRMAQEGFVL